MIMKLNTFAGSVPTASDGVGFAIGLMFVIMLVGALVSFGVVIATYIFQSLGLYRIAKRRGIRNEWLAWLPVGNVWILGSISDQYRYVAKGQVKNRRKTMLVLTVVAAVLSALIGVVSVVGGFIAGLSNRPDLHLGQLAIVLLLAVAIWVVAVVQLVIEYIAYYDLYRSCDEDKAVLFLVLSIFFTIAIPFFVFAVRNKDEGMPPRKQKPAPIPAPEVPAEEPAETVVEAEVVDPQPADMQEE